MKKSKFTTLDSLSLQEFDENSELIPLMTPEDEEEINNEELPETLPILSLRNTVLFPGVVIPITAGRDASIKLINDANKGSKVIGVVAQKDESVENPTAKDIHETGTVARILRVLKMPDGNVTVIIQGKKRFKVAEVITEKPYMNATVRDIPEAKPAIKNKEFSAIIDSIKDLALEIIKESPNIPSEASFAIKNIESNSFLVNFVSSNMNLSVAEKQALLEMNNLKERALATLKFMNVEFQKLELKNDIQSRVQMDMNQQQREYFLHQQMKTIQEELGGVSHDEEVEEMKARAKEKQWDEKVAKHFNKEIAKMQRMNPQVAEYSIQRNYLELFLDLPWNEFSKDKFDLKRAMKILDRDHFGLEDVKRRIIEYLAVLKLRNDMKSPILCLYGPPGVGKTSLGKSIAEALGREYVRISLGGLRDEAEIRGHRKTYIGAMPGRIIQSLKKAGTSNPVFVLDEIDKLSNSHQGDPSSAMLEVLDPEQNSEFYDNFLEMGYDLSKVMFIATSNSLSTIQPALRDRMEIIDLSGYSIEEKVEISQKHLIPNQLELHGLKKSQLKFTKTVLEKLIDGYTRESGVRNIERVIASVIRSVAKRITMDEPFNTSITFEEITEFIGKPRFERDRYLKNNPAGVAVGLAYTTVGGDILFIESSKSAGKPSLKLTGSLGDVMKESATIALSLVKANAEKFGISLKEIDNAQVHVHVPEGATPKDGPSAGITLLTTLVSLFTGRKVKPFLAMTGEITLRGKVLPVGGIKEKVLAAKRAGIKEIIMCKMNQKDVEEINQDYVKGVKFHFVDKMEEVIELALVK